MKPRFSRILWSDWPALYCAVTVPLIWVVMAACQWLVREPGRGGNGILLIALPISLAALAGLMWRISRIHDLFRRGVSIQGVLTMIRIGWDRGTLHFRYDWDGETVPSWMPVHRNSRVLALEPGQAICVLVDPRRPRKAIIRELFT